jgi:hypothetical protein
MTLLENKGVRAFVLALPQVHPWQEVTWQYGQVRQAR